MTCLKKLRKNMTPYDTQSSGRHFKLQAFEYETRLSTNQNSVVQAEKLNRKGEFKRTF